ncbi:MAG: DUF2812 domain-containing protein [Chloroflexi bacterium]|jgi:hypothetical protein|nr:DUF2812 domain-containing protein [Anaerolineaceae bacterium]NMB89306.1 DUF2812 domain-containing protein [Chloroflexota bacterium]
MHSEPIEQKHWFWPWQDQEEEAWLGEMARQGRHLLEAGPSGRYTFIPGAPAAVAYRLDDNSRFKDLQEYLRLMEEDGWEHVGAMNGWQYFRKTVDSAAPPENYADAEAKLHRYNRVAERFMWGTAVYSVILAVGSMYWESSLALAAMGVSTLVYAFFAALFFKINQRMNALKRRV